MKYENIFLFLSISLIEANILSENYNVFENWTFGATRRIILNIEIPNTIDSTNCLIECNKLQSCLTVYFKKNIDATSVCELLFSPHNLTNAIVPSSGSNVYQKKSFFSTQLIACF